MTLNHQQRRLKQLVSFPKISAVSGLRKILLQSLSIFPHRHNCNSEASGNNEMRMEGVLLLASEAGDVGTIQSLYLQDMNVLLGVTFEGDTALHIAAREGHLDLVTWILQVNLSLAKARNEDHNTPLHEAAKSGNLGLVEILLQHEHRSDYRHNFFGETALVIASQYGHVETVRRLLEARPYEDVSEWYRSLRRAADRGHAGVFVAMLDNKPDLDQNSEAAILHTVVHGGHLEIVVALLNHHSWFNDSMTKNDEHGRCAIHVAAIEGRWEIINEFMSRMPDSLHFRSSDHKSVLHFAVEYDQFDVVEKLLENKEPEEVLEMVSLDSDRSGNTALHLAAINGVSPQVLDLLLPCQGHNLNFLNKEGMTALDIASAAPQDNSNCAYIVRRLKAAGAIRSRLLPKSNKTKKTLMVAATLIATVSFAAMLQITGVIEDDKHSIHYGATKSGLHKFFRLFLFSDTAALTASLAFLTFQYIMVARLLLRQPSLSQSSSKLSLLLSIFSTVLAFL